MADPSTVCDSLESKTYCTKDTNQLFSSVPAPALEGRSKKTSASCTSVDFTGQTDVYYIFKCADENSCDLLDLSTDTIESIDDLLVYQYDGANFNKKTDMYYYSNSKLIHCDIDGACKLVTDIGYYVNPDTDDSESLADNPLILVGEDGQAIPIAKTEINNGKYIDASSKNVDKYTKLFNCSGSPGATTCSSSGPAQGIYINEAAEGLTDALISCDETVECETLTPSASGVYVDKGNNGHIIECVKNNDENDKCTSIAGSQAPGYAYIDAINDKKQSIILCSGGNPGTCTSDDTTIKTLNAASKLLYYIDASDITKLITCTGHASQNSIQCVSDSKTSGIYAYGADSVIRCTSTGCISSKSLKICSDTTSSALCKYIDTNFDTQSIADDHYCIIATGTLYKADNDVSDKCKDQNGNAWYVFKSDGSLPAAETSNLLVYSCNSSSPPVCTQVISSIYLDSTTNPTQPILYSCDSDGLCNKSVYNDVITAGYYVSGLPVLENGKLTYSSLIKCGETVVTCISEEISDGYYLNGNANNLDTALISCSTGKCIEEDGIDGGFYLGADEKPIIGCEGTDCSELDGVVGGYYVEGTLDEESVSNLISCSSTTSCESNACPSKGNYIDASDISKIITCDDDKRCTSENHNASTEKYYVDGDNGRIITCVSAGCHLEDPSIKGYFLNAANTIGTESNNLIKCSGTGEKPCVVVEEDAEDYNGPGTVKVVVVEAGEDEFGSRVEASTTITLCIGDCDSATVDLTENTYEAMTVEADKFPGASAGDILVKIGSYGSAILLEPASLPTCTITCEEDKYCIDNDGKIKEKAAEGDTCVDITNGSAGTFTYFFDYEGNRLEEPSSGTTNDIMAYQCTFIGQDKTLEGCSLVKGYVFGSYVNQCSGWKREGCTVVSPSTCMVGIEGEVGTGNSICFEDSGIETSTPSKIAFKATSINSIYGVAKDEIVILSLSENQAVISSPTIGIYKDLTSDGYIQCKNTRSRDCTTVTAPSIINDCSVITEAGQLGTDGNVKLCLAVDKLSSTFGAAGEYLVSYTTNSVFSFIGKSKYALVIVNENSILLEDDITGTICVDHNLKRDATELNAESCPPETTKYTCTLGSCIDPKVDSNNESISISKCDISSGMNCKSNTYYIIDKTTNTEADEGSLYFCESDNKACIEKNSIGYYIVDNENIYNCKENGSEMLCSKGTIGSTCDSNSDVGKLYIPDSKTSLYFCLSSGIGMELNNANTGNYIVERNSNRDIFGLDVTYNRGIISLNDKEVTFNSKYSNKLKYIYANKIENYKIMEKTSTNTCPTKTGGDGKAMIDNSKIIEYECINGKCKEIPEV